MSDRICILEEPAAPGAPVRRRRLGSASAVVAALGRAKRRQVWVLRDAATVTELIRAMSVTPPGVRRARLVSYERPGAGAAQVMESGFERALLGAGAMVTFEDLAEILRTAHPEDYCVAAEWDPSTDTLALWRGDLSVLVVPMSVFVARGGVSADPKRLSVGDCGQTVRMGSYEASVDALLFERDPDYRRRARKRMQQDEKGLGPSIRRLRLQRGVGRNGFPGLDEKTLARIERGDVERPHRATLEVLAKRLGVTVAELGAF